MIARRPNHPRLRIFVRTLWASEPGLRPEAQREWVLPTGDAHLVFRLSSRPLRLYRDSEDLDGSSAGVSLVGGPRSAAYLRDVSRPVPSVGAQLMPGAAFHLFGVPAMELAEAHTTLEDLWGPAASSAQERLSEEPTLDGRLDLFEAILAARLPKDAAPHPIVTRALPVVARGEPVHQIAGRSGYSHRHFIALFRQEVGLSPKIYQRLQRFQRSLLAITSTPSLAALAHGAGYSDQSHFVRDFRAFTGLAPREYRLRSPSQPNHVPASHPDRR